MNTILLDIVAGKVPYGLDGESPATYLNLVAFHGFLDGSADITHTHVNTSGLEQSLALAPAFDTIAGACHLDTSVGGILDRS